MFSLAVQGPTGAKMVRLLSEIPPGPPPEGGPPPELVALGKKAAGGGQFLGLLTILIFVLMIWQPGGAHS